MELIIRDCKKIGFKKAFTRTIVLLIIMVAVVGYGGFAAYNYFNGAKDFYDFYDKIGEVDNSIGLNTLKNQYVTLEVDHIFEPYAEYYTTKNGIRQNGSEDYYYVFQLEDDYYITVQVSASEKEAYDKLCNQTYDYLDEKTDKLPDTIIFTGGFTTSDAELRQYAQDYFKESGFDVDKDGLDYYLSPYILQSGHIAGMDTTMIWIGVVAVGIMLIWLIGTWIAYLSGRYLKDINEYFEHLSSEERYDIDRDYEYATKAKDIAFGEKWCYGYNKNGIDIVAYKDIVWIYKHITTHRTNGIPTGKTRKIMLYDKNGGKPYELCNGTREQRIDEVMGYLYEKQPNMFVGYSDENVSLFKKDYREMADMAILGSNNRI